MLICSVTDCSVIVVADPNYVKSTSDDGSSDVIEDVENALHVVQIVFLSTFLCKVCSSGANTWAV